MYLENKAQVVDDQIEEVNQSRDLPEVSTSLKIKNEKQAKSATTNEKTTKKVVITRQYLFGIWNIWISLMRFSLMMITIISQQDYRAPCLIWLMVVQAGALLSYAILCLTKKTIPGSSKIAFEVSITLLLASLLTEAPSNRVENSVINILLNILIFIFVYSCVITKIIEFSLELIKSMKRVQKSGGGPRTTQINEGKIAIKMMGGTEENDPFKKF